MTYDVLCQSRHREALSINVFYVNSNVAKLLTFLRRAGLPFGFFDDKIVKNWKLSIQFLFQKSLQRTNKFKKLNAFEEIIP